MKISELIRVLQSLASDGDPEVVVTGMGGDAELKDVLAPVDDGPICIVYNYW